MSQIEQQINNRSRTHQSSGTDSQGKLLVEVVCDDRRVQLGIGEHETIADVKRQALGEMQIPSANPNKYIVIGANRQPLDDRQALRDILAQGQSLEFHLIPQVAFGPACSEK
jgi:hypothetical protein